MLSVPKRIKKVTFNILKNELATHQVRRKNHHKVKSNEKLNVDFYFDTISPYTWPAFEILCRYRNIWGLHINYKPIFMGGINSGGRSPLSSWLETPNKLSYMFMDLEKRNAKFYNIPFKMKKDPLKLVGKIGSLQQQRFVTAVLKNHPNHVENVMRNFWIRAWSEDLDVHTLKDLIIIADKAGMEKKNIDEVLCLMSTAEIKDQLKTTTVEAAERGAFGTPTMYFTDHLGQNEQMFWGSDRFEMVAAMFHKQWLGPDPTMASEHLPVID